MLPNHVSNVLVGDIVPVGGVAHLDTGVSASIGGIITTKVGLRPYSTIRPNPREDKAEFLLSNPPYNVIDLDLKANVV